MLKIAPHLLIAGAVMLGCLTVAADPSSAQSRMVPAGDSLAQTPPIDVRRKQLQAAPKKFRRQYKAYRSMHPTAH